ncbi:hypothetical protein [Sneathiella glossodoripedis]|uniref:hypothetical protein n=1 Tax=Sneathiella glossodoripedis TaxID=418853 RepID=UPI00046ECA80|nr:hypothetical protein [Sneathiella glossodoripedis]
MFRILMLGFLAVVTLSSTGCTTAAVAVLDEKVSQMMGQDCTSVNIMLGESYCKEKRKEIKQEQVYCYRTLGSINCYDRKDPYSSKTPRVREVTELGSLGAKVEYIGNKPVVEENIGDPFATRKIDTSEIE